MIIPPSDTHPRAEEAQIDLIRKSSVAKRISRVRSLSQTTIQLSRRAISRANPVLNGQEVNLLFVKYHYGEDLASHLRVYMEHRTL